MHLLSAESLRLKKYEPPSPLSHPACSFFTKCFHNLIRKWFGEV